MEAPTSVREKLGMLVNDYKMFGARQTLRHVLAYLLTIPDDEFDREDGVATRGQQALPEHGIELATLENAHFYEPTREQVMRHILRYASARLSPRTLSFVDLGCGKGRALLLAAELPFLEVIGVELSAAHCATARANLARYWAEQGVPKRTHVRVCQSDVLSFTFPNTDLLIYMFNPFHGPVFRGVLDRLTQFQYATGHKVHLILSSPQTEHLLEAHPAFSRLHEFQVIRLSDSWSHWSCKGPGQHSPHRTAPSSPDYDWNGAQLSHSNESTLSSRSSSAAVSGDGGQRIPTPM